MRSSLIGLGLTAVLAAPAMAQNECSAAPTALHTKDAVVMDKTSHRVLMVVCPTSDAELGDPSFNPPGSQQFRVNHVAGQDPIQQALAANAIAGMMGPRQLFAAASVSLSASVSSSVSACTANAVCSASVSASQSAVSTSLLA